MGIHHEACDNLRSMSDTPPNTRFQRWLPAVLRLLGRVPLPLLYGIADLLFFALFRVFGFQRALANDNVARAFPHLPAAQVAQLAAQSAKNAAHVVFVTAYEQHSVDAFEAAAVDYLLKPVEPEEVRQAAQQALERLCQPFPISISVSSVR